MNKVKNWQAEFVKVIRNCEDKDFKYGSHDCCMMAGNIVKAITGEDPLSGYRGKYGNYKKAMSILKNAPDGLESLVTEVLGEPKNINYAKRGDVVFYNGDTLGICTGMKSIFPEINGGVVYKDTLECSIAWDI